MDKLTLITTVKRYMNRYDLLDSDVGLMIPMVEGQLNRYFADHPRNQRRATLTQLAGNEILPLPVDLMNTIRLYTDAGSYRQFPADARDNAASASAAYIARGTCLELFPTPAEDTVFHLDYIASLQPLVGEGDTNWVLEYFTDVYLYGVMKEACVWLKDDARLNAWNAQFMTRVAEVGGQGWSSNIAASPKITNG